MFFDLSLITLIGYATIFGAFVQNTAYLFEARALWISLDESSLASFVLDKVNDQPKQLRDDSALDDLAAEAVSELVGSLRMRIERLSLIAPSLGFLFTIIGLAVGSAAFGESGDQQDLLSNLALALMTTIGSTIVLIVGQYTLKSFMDPLEDKTLLKARRMVRLGRDAYRCALAGSSNNEAESNEARPIVTSLTQEVAL